MAIAEPEAKASAAPARAQLRARARTRFNQSMRLVRRAHLYAGLFMTPWVFLYGVTAMLFNHPMAFPDLDQKIQTIAPDDLAGTPLANFPTPRALADQVVTAINKATGPESPETYRLVEPETAAFARDYSTTVPGKEGVEHLVRLDLATGHGSVRSITRRNEARRETEPPPPFARRPIELDSAPMTAISGSVSQLLTRFGLPQAPAGASSSTGEPPASTSIPRDGNGEREREPRRKGRRSDERRKTDERAAANVRVGEGEGEGGVESKGEAGSADRPGPDASRPRRRGEGDRRNESQAVAAPGNGPGGPGPGGRGGRRIGPVGPELNFKMQGEGQVWRVGYNLQTGILTGRPDDGSPTSESLSNRRFLLRLHTAHGYPAQLNARWVWAIAVDVMFVCMVGWGLSGLLMWWQMKNVRRVGVILLVLSALVSVATAVGMHGMMVSGS